MSLSAEISEGLIEAAREDWQELMPTGPNRHLVVLAYISSLQQMGCYHHKEMLARYGENVTDRVIWESHAVIWLEWVQMSLSEQAKHFDEYCRVHGNQVVLDWNDVVCRKLTPATAPSLLENLFRRNLEALVELRLKKLEIQNN